MERRSFGEPALATRAPSYPSSCNAADSGDVYESSSIIGLLDDNLGWNRVSPQLLLSPSTPQIRELTSNRLKLEYASLPVSGLILVEKSK